MSGLTDSQVLAEVALAQNDIEQRLNALEHRVGRSVASMALERLDITTVADDRRRFVRTVRIEVSAPVGRVGEAA